MTDFFRFWWSLLRWNLSKTLFVLRGRKGRAPCQHPSDSGKGGVTACEACATWRRPSRFRHVCPLLVRNEAGLRCSVDAAKVRPFWGRAMIFGIVGGGTFYCLIALAALVTFRWVGYETLRYSDFFSPEFRTRFRVAQSGYYAKRADALFTAGDYRGGLLALSVAYNKNPRDFATGLTLARLLQRSNQPRIGDDIFGRMMSDFPDRADEVSAVWSEALLFRGDWLKLVRLSAERVSAEGPTRGAWMRTLVFALRKLPDPEVDAGFAECTPRVEGAYSQVIEAERAIRAGNSAAARAIVASLPAPSDSFLAQYAIEFALETRDLTAASIAAASLERTLGSFFHNLYLARIAADQGQPAVAALSFGNLLAAPLTLEKIDFACAEILRRPSKDRFRMVLESFSGMDEANSRPEFVMAMVAAAAAAGDAEGLERLYQSSATLDGTTITRLRLLADSIAGISSEISPQAVLSSYPFPRETMLALIDWFAKRPAARTET